MAASQSSLSLLSSTPFRTQSIPARHESLASLVVVVMVVMVVVWCWCNNEQVNVILYISPAINWSLLSVITQIFYETERFSF